MKTPKHVLVAEMPLILLSFLIKRKALGPFLNAIMKDSYVYNTRTAIKWAQQNYSDRRIDLVFLNPFTWCYTPEGYDFWYNINIAWQKLLNKKNIGDENR